MWSAIPAQERPVRNVPTAGFDCAKIMRKPVARVSRFSVRPAVSYTEGSTRSQHTEPRAKKSLKPAELRLQTLVLFPVSQSYKLIQNFLQSLEPPFLSAIIIPAFNAVTGI